MSIFKRNKVEQFKKKTEGKSKEEVREAEEALLVPENLPKYEGKQPTYKSELASRGTLIVFSSREQRELIGEIFSIKTSISNESYITNIDLLENIARMVKNGDASIDNGRIILNGNPTDNEPVDGRCTTCGRKIKDKKGGEGKKRKRRELV